MGRLIGDNADTATVVSAEANDDVGGKIFLDFEKVGVIDRMENDPNGLEKKIAWEMWAVARPDSPRKPKPATPATPAASAAPAK